MIIHCAMGAILGALLALALMVANRHIFHFIASSSSPLAEMAFFVDFISFVFAIGATLSGFIFTAIELNAVEAKQRTERFNRRRDFGNLVFPVNLSDTQPFRFSILRLVKCRRRAIGLRIIGMS